MTGYGKTVSTIGKYIFEIEIKSLNNRFLEISLKLPPALQQKEYEIREAIKQKLRRGKLYVAFNARIDNGGEANVTVDETKIKELLASLSQVKTKFNLKGKIKISDLLGLKEIFNTNFDDFSDEDFEVLKKSLFQCIDNLLLMKQNEGGELVKDIKNRLASMLTLLEEIEEHQKSALPEHYDKMRARVQELTSGTIVNPERMELEIALLSDKSDITEECVRTKSHIKFFEEILAQGEDAGRKLNFLCQELNREANTISSKSISSVITKNSVFLKEEIERIREQVQNVE